MCKLLNAYDAYDNDITLTKNTVEKMSHKQFTCYTCLLLLITKDQRIINEAIGKYNEPHLYNRRQ